MQSVVIGSGNLHKKSPSSILPRSGGEGRNESHLISFPRLGGRLGWGLLVILFLITAEVGYSAEPPYKIRIGFPSLAFSYMPFYVAQEKGFYKKHGIESEYIQMGTTIQPQAVVAGNINYFTSVSAGISAAVAGLPLVIVISFCDSSPWVLVTNKDINKPQDL